MAAPPSNRCGAESASGRCGPPRSSSGRARTASTTRCRSSPVAARRSRRARADCDAQRPAHRRLPPPVPASVCGAATTLLALNACSEESTPRSGAPQPGGTFDVPPTAAVDPDAARAALAGDEFVFDVQGHFLDYSGRTRARSRAATSGPASRSSSAARPIPRVCFSINHFMEEVFLRSDTSMVVLSALPIAPEGSPLSPEADGRRAPGRRRGVPRRARAAPRPGAPERRRPPGEPRRHDARRSSSTRSWRGRCSPTSRTCTTARATRGASTTATRRWRRSATRSSATRSSSASRPSPRTRALDDARLHVAARVTRRLRARRAPPSRRPLRRVPLRLRGRRHRGSVRRRPRATAASTG